MVEDSKSTMLKAYIKFLVTRRMLLCSNLPQDANKNEILWRFVLTALYATIPDFTE